MTLSIMLFLVGVIAVVYFVAKEQYDKMEVVVLDTIGLIFWTFLIVPIPVMITGFHYEIGRGEHTGYVTAVQKQGVFFKTGRAYIKTDTESSQEDTYCVMDEKVYADLQELSKNHEKVTVKYFQWFTAGVKNCDGEGDIIYEVTK